MTTLTITCITTDSITSSGEPLQDVQTGLNAVLPAGYTVTEIYCQLIGTTPFTANRFISVGHENNDDVYTGSNICGIPTGELNDNDHVALTDIGGIGTSRQLAAAVDQEFQVKAKCAGDVSDGQLRLVIKMKSNPGTSNPQ